MFYQSSEDGTIKILHLAKQSVLASSDPSGSYMEVANSVPERTRLALSHFCRLVFRNHTSKGLRYSATRTDEFLPDGMLKIDRNGTGFTCATLVKGIFDANGWPIIDEGTWPKASGEDTFIMRIVNNIWRRLAPSYEPHYRVVDQDLDVNCKWSRFKSEDVAAASTLAPPKAKYYDVLPEALRLVKAVNTYPVLGPTD
jgi:hypothetical protein